VEKEILNIENIKSLTEYGKLLRFEFYKTRNRSIMTSKVTAMPT
jgi:hypothetical protein